MKNEKADNYLMPVSIHEIALLQAYLYEMFTLVSHCKQDFEHTEWYLKGTHSEDETRSVIEYFKSKDLKCDCDIIFKIDLREYAKDIKQHHTFKE